MSKLLAITLMLAVVLALDPVSAHQDAASPLLRVVDGGRVLEEESSSASTNSTLTNPLYEANTSIKGCHWYDYFLPWSCCGANSCKTRN
ncbi:hypothetical protein PF005_g24504 [Phytophthora fragariae]|uniref:RxLR effector protein n=1 Tax=Phytophthora fragariae TaxID=53985 RepID=A0A6A3QIV5_9STRA|nr:hypothetical protein PF003_g35564 [Phytophthora fragariae]KAE8924470.1 hypothetical protein PF009_g25297 [Phytophthora fragariae]KAE8978373.1 hypothetical protein PF011_g23270 [Phytophthora fragariae]KAE9076391.1 hypothetical protein PF010_g23917 [Phytophthora fragariae]KAE9076771.1 hypothetical protein PF007_g24499 [Phytophthora fragariae]